MKKSIYLLISLFISVFASAQSQWNWPSDQEEQKLAKEKQAYYKIQFQMENYNGALKALNYLYNVAPDLNESIYIDGAKALDELLTSSNDQERQKRLRDSILWTFDMRIKYFDNDATALDRKAYTAFKLYYKNPDKYALLRSLYQDLYDLKYNEISDFNLTPYMTLANYYYKSNPEEFTAKDVINVHQTITQVIDQKLENGGNKTKLQKEQDKVDAFLNALDGILTCKFLEENMVPKFESDPDNLNQAKKIFTYSIKAKCTDTDYFIKATETLFNNDSSYELAKVLGDRNFISKNMEKALQYYKKAVELAPDDEKKFDALMGKATAMAKLDQLVMARATAYKALKVKPGASEPYNLIGNIYFTSYQECKKGKSIVKDRAVYLAAYDMYSAAGNTEQMTAAKQQFPSKEEIFNEEYESGQKITVDCWIEETVVIRSRD